jgi:hypothetical protein
MATARKSSSGCWCSNIITARLTAPSATRPPRRSRSGRRSIKSRRLAGWVRCRCGLARGKRKHASALSRGPGGRGRARPLPPLRAPLIAPSFAVHNGTVRTPRRGGFWRRAWGRAFPVLDRAPSGSRGGSGKRAIRGGGRSFPRHGARISPSLLPASRSSRRRSVASVERRRDVDESVVSSVPDARERWTSGNPPSGKRALPAPDSAPARRCHEVALVQNHGTVARLEQMAGHAQARVDDRGLAPIRLAGRVGGIGNEDQMNMIGHQAIDQTATPCLLHCWLRRSR